MSSITVDDNFLDAVWDWLEKHPDIQIEAVNDDSQILTPEVGISSTASRTHSSFRHAGQRIFTNEDRAWQVITGHGVDYARIPRLMFECLSVIAAHGPEGVIQPTVTHLTGQDKRSVPKRTDNLAEMGYITKESVIAEGLKTTHLRLTRFANNDAHPGLERARAYPTTTTKDVDMRVGTYYDDWLDDMLRLLKQNGNIMAFPDLCVGLGIFGNRKYIRALHVRTRRLSDTGCIQKIKARVEGEGDDPGSGQWIRSIQLMRDPSEADRRKFITRSKLLQSQVQDDDDDANQDDELEDAESDNDDAGVVEQAVEHLKRIPPQWTPDQLYTNFLFNIIDSAGPQGISSMELSRRALGPTWRRPLDEIMLRLTDVWQKSQPPHLRHLSIVRDTALEGRLSHFKYRTYHNFEKAVEMGLTQWEAVTGNQNKAGKGRGRPNKASELDHWGFVKPDPKLFAGKDGTASLFECQAAARKDVRLAGDSFGEQGDAATPITPSPKLRKKPGPKPRSTSIVLDTPTKSATRTPRSRKKSAPAAETTPQSVQTSVQPAETTPRSVETSLQATQTSFRSVKKPRLSTKNDQLEYEQRAKRTAEMLAKAELRRRNRKRTATEAGLRRDESVTKAPRLRQGSSASNDGEADANEDLDDSRVAAIEADLISRIEPGVYINPPGAKDLKYDTLMKPGHQKRALIAVIKSTKLSRLSWFTPDNCTKARLGPKPDGDLDGGPDFEEAERPRKKRKSNEAFDDVHDNNTLSIAEVADPGTTSPLAAKKRKGRPPKAVRAERESASQLNKDLSLSEAAAAILDEPDIALAPKSADTLSTGSAAPDLGNTFNTPPPKTTSFGRRTTSSYYTRKPQAPARVSPLTTVATPASAPEPEAATPAVSGNQLLNSSPHTSSAPNPTPTPLAKKRKRGRPSNAELQEREYLRKMQETTNSGFEGTPKEAEAQLPAKSSLVVKLPLPQALRQQSSVESSQESQSATHGSLKPSRIVRLPLPRGSKQTAALTRHVANETTANTPGLSNSFRLSIVRPYLAPQNSSADQTDHSEIHNTLQASQSDNQLREELDWASSDIVSQVEPDTADTQPEPVALLSNGAIGDTDPVEQQDRTLPTLTSALEEVYDGVGERKDADNEAHRPADPPGDEAKEPGTATPRSEGFDDVPELLPVKLDADFRYKQTVHKKAGITRGAGSVHFKREHIVKETMRKAGGVFPGDHEIWYPFVTAWQRTYSGQPERSTVENVVNLLLKNKELKKFKFQFRDQNGKVVQRHILTEPSFNASSAKAKKMQRAMIDSWPYRFLPKQVPVLKHLRERARKISALPNKGLTHDRDDTDDEDSTYKPPVVHSNPVEHWRGTFPNIPTATVKRTTEGIAIAGSNPESRRNKTSTPTKATPKKLEEPFDTSEDDYSTDDSDLEEVSAEQTALQGSFKLGAYNHVPMKDAAPRQGSRPRPTLALGSAVGDIPPKQRSGRKPRNPVVNLLMRSVSVFHKSSGTFGTLNLQPSMLGTLPTRVSTGMAGRKSQPRPKEIATASSPKTTGQKQKGTKNAAQTVENLKETTQIEHLQLSVQLPQLAPAPSLDQYGFATPYTFDQQHQKLPLTPLNKAKPLLVASGYQSQAPETHSQILIPKQTGKPIRPYTYKPRQRTKKSTDVDISADACPFVDRESDNDYGPGEDPIPGNSARKSRKSAAPADFKRLAIGLALVRMLSKGVKSSQGENWAIVKHVLGFEGDTKTLQQQWKSRQKGQYDAAFARRLLEAMVDPFLEAYESGELPSIDFYDLEGTEWPALINWVDTKIVPLLTGHKKQALPKSLENLAKNFEIDLLVPKKATNGQYASKQINGADGGPIRSNRAREGSVWELDQNGILEKSWIRAIMTTKAVHYKDYEAAQNIATFRTQTVEKLTEEMVETKTLIPPKKGHHHPGRNYSLSDYVLSQFKRWPGDDSMFLRDVSDARDALLKHFNEHNELEQSSDESEAQALVLATMVAQGHLRPVSGLFERNDDFDASRPNLSKWMSIDKLHSGKELDTSDLLPRQVFKKTPNFTPEHRLKPNVPIPMYPPAMLGEDSSRIPLWMDIHGNFVNEFWDMVLHSVLHVLVHNHGLTAERIETLHKSKLWAWEIEMVLSWMEKVGLAERIGAGEEATDGVWKGAWRASEWWYCAFAPDAATW